MFRAKTIVRLLREPLVWSGVALLALHALIFASPLVGEEPPASVYYSAYLVYLTLTLAAVGRSLRAAGRPADRRFWGLLGIALGFWWVTSLLYLLVSRQVMYRSLAAQTVIDILFLLFYLGVVFAAEQRPDLEAEERPQDREQRLEITGLVVFSLTLLLYFVAIPNLLGPPRAETGQTLESFLFFLVLDLYLVLRFAYLTRVAPSIRWRWTYGLLAAAPLVWMVTDALDLLMLTPRYQIRVPVVLSPLWYLPFVLVVAATRVRALVPVDREVPAAARRVVRPRRLVLYIVALFLIHIGLSLFRDRLALTHLPREVLVVAASLVLAVLAQLQYEYLQRRSERLLDERKDALDSLRRSRGELEEKNDQLQTFADRLEEIVARRTVQIRETRDMALVTLAKLTESRDRETGRHLERVAAYCERLAGELRRGGSYADAITVSFVDELQRSSPLHDIGKVGVPDAILHKQGTLTAREIEVMRRHTVVGGDTLRSVLHHYEGDTYLTMAMEIAYHHHEHWDGSGYPQGLAGTQIPLPARLVALVDAYDAITSDRSYEKACSHEEALRRIVRDRGHHFDPVLVDAFVACHQDFQKIRTRLA